MLTIPNKLQSLEVAEDVAHQQVLLAKKIRSKHKNITMLLKQNWKSVGIAKENITNLIRQLQPQYHDH